LTRFLSPDGVGEIEDFMPAGRAARLAGCEDEIVRWDLDRVRGRHLARLVGALTLAGRTDRRRLEDARLRE